MMKKICAVYFSATKTTEKVVCEIAGTLAEKLQLPWERRDFTLPSARTEKYSFGKEDIVILGTPVYAGRVPNVLLPFLKSISGKETPGIPVVVFGNRSFDDALAELRDIMEEQGFVCPAAAAFVGEHAFSDVLAAGRPDEEDLRAAREFAARTAAILKTDERKGHVAVPGNSPSPGYFKPKGPDGSPVDIRKVKPLVNDDCDNCKRCVGLCPMGSISEQNVQEYSGICIKCGACIKGCPRHARYYDDPDYLFHKKDLEERLKDRAEIGMWFQ